MKDKIFLFNMKVYIDLFAVDNVIKDGSTLNFVNLSIDSISDILRFTDLCNLSWRELIIKVNHIISYDPNDRFLKVEVSIYHNKEFCYYE